MPTPLERLLPSDEDLAVRAQNGCMSSYEQIVRRYQVPLMQFLMRRTNHNADAEDLLQQTVLRAYQNLHRYRAGWRFRAWLFTIANRLAANHHRQKRATLGGDFLESCCEKEVGPLDALAAEESRRSLWDAAARALSDSQFTVVWLYYVEDLSVAEIARVLCRSRMAVKATLFRARRKLLRILETKAQGSETIEIDHHGLTCPAEAKAGLSDV